MAEWNKLEIGWGKAIEPAIGSVDAALSGIMAFIEVSVVAIEVLSSFLTVSQSPYLAAIQHLLSEMAEMINNVSNTSCNGLFVVPSSLEELPEYKGGFGKFRQLVIESIFDLEDPNRPQIPKTGMMGGIVLYTQRGNPSELIKAIHALYTYLGKFHKLQYPVPVQLNIIPTNSIGLGAEEVEALANPWTYFGGSGGPELNALKLSWSEPRIRSDIFLDIFLHNKFYIECSNTVTGNLRMQEVDPKDYSIAQKNAPEGTVFYEPKLDEDGQLSYHWAPLNPNDPFIAAMSLKDPLAFLSGTYSHTIKDVEKGIDNALYYRVRSLPKDAVLSNTLAIVRTPDGQMAQQRIHIPMVNGKSILKSCPPSLPVLGMIPEVDTSFDMPTALLNVYRLAYQLRMDIVIEDLGKVIQGSDSLQPKISETLYNSLKGAVGVPAETTEVVMLPDNSGVVEKFVNKYFPHGMFPDEEHITFRQAKKFGRDSLTVIARDVNPFSGIDEFIAPRTSLPDNERFRLEVDRHALRMVDAAMPYLTANESLFELIKNLYQTSEMVFNSHLKNGISILDLFGTTRLRQDVCNIIELVGKPSRLGAPPNWEAIKISKDLIPWVGEVGEMIVGLLKSLDNVFQSPLDQLKATLSTIQARIDVINNLIANINELIQLIMDVANILIDFEMLLIGPETGGVPKFVANFRDSQNPPNTDPDQFMSGIVLTFGTASGSDFTGTWDAIQLLFG